MSLRVTRVLFDDRFVQAGRVDPPHRAGHAVGRIDDPGSLGFGQVRPHGQGPAAVLFDFVRTEHLERIFVIAMNHWANRVEGELGLHDSIRCCSEFAEFRFGPSE